VLQFGLALLYRDILGHRYHSLIQVGRGDDIVSVEHRTRLVASRLHCDPFRYSGAHEVIDQRPFEAAGAVEDEFA
jgi:hypothetical protein